MSYNTFRGRKSKIFDDSTFHYIVPKNEEISSSITKNWTDQAILCYSSNYNCGNCEIGQANYSFVCQMKNVVKILLVQVGPPEETKLEKVIS